ncbi:MAG: CvpA family protein [Myxococcota bacterium]
MWLDALALLLLGVFAGMGMLRGGLAAGMGLLSIAVSYAAAILCATAFGPTLAGWVNLPEFLGLPIAGMAGFTGGYLLMGLLSRFLQNVAERRRRGMPRSARDRFTGGVFGFARGALVVLLLSWLAIWVDALRQTGALEGMPEIGDSRAASVTESVVEAGVGAALGDAGAAGKFAARMAARPGASVSDIQGLLDSPRLEALREDKLFWTYLEAGAIDSALNQVSFVRIIRDAEFRERLGALGLVDESAVSDPRAFRRAAGEALRSVAPRLRGLRDDPELKQLMENPDIVAMVESGNTLGLLSHSGFRRVVTRVASRD